MKARYAATVESNPREVTALVTAVNAIAARSRMELYRQIGALVLDGLFPGEADGFGHAHRHHPSYRALARHPGLAISATTLWRAVALEAQCRLLPRHLVPQLTLAQHRALLRMPNGPYKSELARLAVDRCWSGEDLGEAVREHVGSRPGGRPRLAEVTKAVRAIERALDGITEAPEAANPETLRMLDAQIARLHGLRQLLDRPAAARI